MEIDPIPNGSGSAATTTPEIAATRTALIAASNTPSSKLSQLTESLKLEHQFLRVPFEHFKKTIRANHRTVEKELSAVISNVADVADSDELHKNDAVLNLTSLVSGLQGLKRKVKEDKSLILCLFFSLISFYFLS